MIEAALAGIGLVGPGFTDWTRAAPLLRAPQLWSPTPTVVPAPTRLPANERRRAGPVVKAALAVADEAVAMAGAEAAALATVFTSSTGDPLNCHQLCEALATSERLVSPTRFTNSVHNAAAGYWHIAVRGMQASTSLAAYDASFAAGLLEAAALCVSQAQPVLLVACDVPFPPPLHALRPIADVFACALLLRPRPDRWTLTIATGRNESPTPVEPAALEALRRSVPAARALPVLQALARDAATRIVLDDEHGFCLALQVEPAR